MILKKKLFFFIMMKKINNNNNNNNKKKGPVNVSVRPTILGEFFKTNHPFLILFSFGKKVGDGSFSVLARGPFKEKSDNQTVHNHFRQFYVSKSYCWEIKKIRESIL